MRGTSLVEPLPVASCPSLDPKFVGGDPDEDGGLAHHVSQGLSMALPGSGSPLSATP